MFHGVWVLYGVVMIGTLILMGPVEAERKIQPNGREWRAPRVLRADRASLSLLLVSIDLIAATAFLMWPLAPFTEGNAPAWYYIALVLGPALSIAPVAFWLVRALDTASRRPTGESGE